MVNVPKMVNGMQETLVNRAAVAPVEILLVEDNPGDVRLTLEIFKEGKLANRIITVEDGVEAMAYLRREGKYANALRPGLILLDLNLPRMDGRVVLEKIKRDESLRTIPVIVLTISRDEEDVLRSYNLHANCYITKPVDLNQFTKVVRSIEGFWLTVVKLPSGGSQRK
jgi:CheY-like chemotaxis protein